VLATVRHTLRQRELGLSQTLDAMLAQERDVLAFAGEPLRYDEPTRASILSIVGRNLNVVVFRISWLIVKAVRSAADEQILNPRVVEGRQQSAEI